jgi:hypothetical protein
MNSVSHLGGLVYMKHDSSSMPETEPLLGIICAVDHIVEDFSDK